MSLRIAWRYLFSRKSHSAVNIISAISMAGVAVATVATVCVLSVFNGFADVAASRLGRVDPDLMVERPGGEVLTGADSLSRSIEGLAGVARAVPTLSGRALAVYGDGRFPVRLKGVGEGYADVADIGALVIDGEYMDAADAYSGGRAAEPLRYANLSIGVAVQMQKASPTFFGPLRLYVPRRLGRINPANPLGSFAADSLLVGSVFEVDQPEWDSDMVLAPLSTVRHLFEYADGEATAIEVALAPGADIGQVSRSIEELLPGTVARDKTSQQEYSSRMIAVEKWITLMLLAFILVIASFNIISTLSILIIDKADNIRTLRSLGASGPMIRRIFLLQGWLVSVGGGLIGLVIGVALCLAQQTWGFIRLSGDAARLTIQAYPVRVNPADLLIVLGLVALVGLLSTLVTRGAAALHPDRSAAL